MQIPYPWLKEWVDVPWDAQELGARLTMVGFELEVLEQPEAGGPVLVLNITPNRGDAMSIRGIAREVAALSAKPLLKSGIDPVAPKIQDSFPVRLSAPAACPKFVGRVIRGVNNRASSPQWLRERLTAAGVRSISPIVDVTNYVMLELGTPMHAYDLARLVDGIDVRFAAPAEALRLLDGQDKKLDVQALVIADGAGAVGIAGVMGGERTAVNETTADVFFELAFFAPTVISATARRYGLITDAAQRFERGVDPQAQEAAIERATQLLIGIAGGQAGPTVSSVDAQRLPKRPSIDLRRRQLARLIGADVPDVRVTQIFQSLDMKVQSSAQGWTVTPPSHRFDVGIEADLIEEVARVFGYDAIPEQDARIAQVFTALPEAQLREERVLALFADRGYQEAITYSFVDPQLQETLFPGTVQLLLKNAIAADMSAMRVSLWPGLLTTARENLRRQQDRVRLFERGNRFVVEDGGLRETTMLAGVAVGNVLPEQWGEKKRSIDFYDVKGDLQALIDATGGFSEFEFVPDALPCLHPGRSARVHRAGRAIGWLGELHPELVGRLDLTYAPIVFELEMTTAFQAKLPVFTEVSRYPSIRRDLAVVVDEQVPLAAIAENVSVGAPRLLRSLQIFDVYRGPGIDSGRKSVALGLILQETSRTLTDQDADRIVAAVIERLQRELNASIRA